MMAIDLVSTALRVGILLALTPASQELEVREMQHTPLLSQTLDRLQKVRAFFGLHLPLTLQPAADESTLAA